MDDRGPWTGHLTKPEQSAKKRFDLEWIVPLELGLLTHVTLLDLETVPPHAVAVGQGGDEAETLLDLWTTLIDRGELEEALAFVSDAYQRRTGRPVHLRPHD